MSTILSSIFDIIETHNFWDEYDRRTLYRIMVALERVESWAVDKYPEIDVAINRLGEIIHKGELNFHNINNERLMRILASVRATRALRIMQALDAVKKNGASEVLIYAESIQNNPKASPELKKFADIFLHRNLIFERMQLLSRIFSPNRISLVSRALEDLTD